MVFVPGGLPGEAADVDVWDSRRDFARAQLVGIERPAPGRIEPPCPHYREGCGGCSWQHADYTLQLQLKQSIVVDQLKRIGHFPDAHELVRPPLAMVEPW